MGNTTELRQEVKRRIVPFAEARGFKLDLRYAPQFFEFRRVSGGVLHIFDIQWDKRGKRRFIVNFGMCPSDGVECNGQRLSADLVSPAHCSVRGRLYPGKGSLTSSWFRQDKPFLMRLFMRGYLYPPDQVVGQLITLFPELETYWSIGSVGPHLRIF